MSPPVMGIGDCNGLQERNYFGLCDCSSVDSSAVPEENKSSLNLKATELRLGLPGSQSPEHDSDEKELFPLSSCENGVCLQKSAVSRNKRGFYEGSWVFGATRSDSEQSKIAGSLWSSSHLEVTPKPSKECNNKQNCSVTSGNAASKAQVVGWPPIRSFRKNTLDTKCGDGKQSGDGLFVKVSMDGAPYLRKVDLRMYYTYQDLSSALETMFSCFIAGQCLPHGGEMMNESKLKDVHGSEYVLTYEDKDGDWMLVGDVPWEMFIGSCKRLKIMKACDAIGLGVTCEASSTAGAVEKGKNFK